MSAVAGAVAGAGAGAAAAGTQPWTVRALLAWSREWLASKGVESPRLDAELLLGRALRVERIRLYVEHDKPLQPEELARFKALILRRAAREPVAYLLGEKEFYGRRFAVDRRCFIPRPETELVVQALLQHLGAAHPNKPGGRPEGAGPLRALDLCCGSGAIGVSLAAERADLEVDLVELSPEAAAVARTNAEVHAPGRAHVLEGDLFGPLPPGRRYAVIAANPPYVPSGEAGRLQAEVVSHEPHLALFGGPDGLDVVRRLLAEAPRWLEPGGLLAMELDPPEGEAAIALALAAGFASARLEADLAHLDRILVARAPAGI